MIDTGTTSGAGASDLCLAHDQVTPDVCPIAAREIAIDTGVSVTVTGSRPLVLIAVGAITIDGRLDAGSHGVVYGPGADQVGDATSCPTFAGNPTSHGGGAGGSLGGPGGGGGGNENDAGGTIGGPPPAGLRAGCAGQNGGSSSLGHGLGGLGGGAVMLVAGTSISVGGALAASGAGGVGGQCLTNCTPTNLGDTANGGGGGGAGGTLVLDTPSITVSGVVFADGGGGGEGASHAHDGAPGVDPMGDVAAPGGTGLSHSGDGGTGSHAIAAGGIGGDGMQSGTVPPGGGGGGGGGAGVIRVHGTQAIVGGMVSPAASFP